MTSREAAGQIEQAIRRVDPRIEVVSWTVAKARQPHFVMYAAEEWSKSGQVMLMAKRSKPVML